MVAVLAHDVGAGARGLQAWGAKALGEAEDSLGTPEAIERAIVEERVDEHGTGGADRGGAFSAPGRGLHEEVDLVRRQMIGERSALARPRAAMGGDEGVLVKQLDLPGGGAHPQALPDEPMRGRVVGAGEDDVTVGVELGLLPLGQLPRRGRHGAEGGALDLVEDLERDPLGGAVDPAPGDLDTPAPQVTIGLVDVAEGAPGEGVALDVVDAALLDLALVLGRARAAGRDEEAVVLGEVAVAALDLRIVEGGVDDRGPEIVEVMCPPRLCGRPAATTRPDRVDCVIAAT